MQVKEININTGKITGYGICKKYKISFLGGPTTPTYYIHSDKTKSSPFAYLV